MTNRCRLGNSVARMVVAACNRAVARNNIMVARAGRYAGKPTVGSTFND